MKELFGTDGIRGHAGDFPLDENTVWIVGASLARIFRERLGRDARFVTGRDTRESGAWIEAALHSGASSGGATCVSAGVITTPGVAYLTGVSGSDAGVVISASHNPFEDNGIKVFLPSGRKLESAAEREIEKDIYGERVPRAVDHPEPAADVRLADQYVEHLASKALSFEGRPFKIVIDCANGAASAIAPRVFGRLNADLVIFNDSPDGRNINANCGSLHLDQLQDRVNREGADIGIAFDGDADRALFVDGNGGIVDGDATLWIMANYLKSHGGLTNSTVVATVMSNIGLEIALKTKDIELIRVPVGDKYVLEKLLEIRSAIGGEQSGHIIFPENSLVGDGMMTALNVLRVVVESGRSIAELTSGFTRFPQILLNVKVGEKRPFADVPAIAALSTEIENELDGQGRLLLRYSGTENLARVMIEGKSQPEIERRAGLLADVIKAELG